MYIFRFGILLRVHQCRWCVCFLLHFIKYDYIEYVEYVDDHP